MSTDEQPPLSGETIEWTPADEAAANRAMARLNAEWTRQESQGVDVNAAMLAEVDALGDD